MMHDGPLRTTTGLDHASALPNDHVPLQIAIHREVIKHRNRFDGSVAVVNVRHETETHTWFKEDVSDCGWQ